MPQSSCKLWHKWQTPVPGDDDIVCLSCGDRIDMTTALCAPSELVYGIKRPSSEFLRALHDAVDDRMWRIEMEKHGVSSREELVMLRSKNLDKNANKTHAAKHPLTVYDSEDPDFDQKTRVEAACGRTAALCMVIDEPPSRQQMKNHPEVYCTDCFGEP